MVNQKLVDYIKENTEKGYTLEQLRTTLLQNGYNAPEIDDVVNYIQTPQQTNSMSSDGIKSEVKKHTGKSTDLKVIICLLALWGIFRLFTVSIPLVSDSFSMPIPNMIFGFAMGVLLLLSVYGLWTIRSWGFKLGMLSVVIVFVENLYLGIYIGALIVGIVGYYIYKNRGLYL